MTTKNKNPRKCELYSRKYSKQKPIPRRPRCCSWFYTSYKKYAQKIKENILKQI